jgi:hypothetical protein
VDCGPLLRAGGRCREGPSGRGDGIFRRPHLSKAPRDPSGSRVLRDGWGRGFDDAAGASVGSVGESPQKSSKGDDPCGLPRKRKHSESHRFPEDRLSFRTKNTQPPNCQQLAKVLRSNRPGDGMGSELPKNTPHWRFTFPRRNFCATLHQFHYRQCRSRPLPEGLGTAKNGSGHTTNQ